MTSTRFTVLTVIRRTRRAAALAALLVMAIAIPGAHAQTTSPDPAGASRLTGQAVLVLTRKNIPPDPVKPVVTLAPARETIMAEPGTRYLLPLVIKNLSPDSFLLRIALRDLEASDDPDSLVQAAPGSPSGAGAWLRPAQRSFVIDSGMQVTLPVLITVPANAAPGVHAAGVSVQRRLTRPSASTDRHLRIAVQASLLAQLLINVAGTAESKAHLQDGTAPRIVRHGERPWFEAKVANDGNTLLKVAGDLEMGSFAGTNAGSYRLEQTLVLPGGQRRLRARWTDPPWVGWFHPTLIVDANDQQLVLRYPTVYVVPPWWLVVLVLVALALPLVVRVARRR